MNNKSILRFTQSLLLGTLFCLSIPVYADGNDMLLAKVLAGPQRSPDNAARDMFRHPRESLLFFGIKPDMQVVEILPGRGWYTEILAPYLSENGKLIAASYGTNNSLGYLDTIHAGFMDKINAGKNTYSRVEVVVFRTENGYLSELADNSVDMVLDFRNTHNFIRWFGGAGDIYKAYFRVLKPGGVLGIIEHRARPGTKAEEVAETGYTPEQYSIDLAVQAGFELAGKSEINANPKDTRDHPNGVWTLPPRSRYQGEDADRYKAIGESDRMTLKFTKP